MFFSIFLYSLLKSSYLIYQEVISTFFPAFANFLLNLLLALLHTFKVDKLRKFIFQPYRFSGHLHFLDLSFMSRYFCRMFLLIISSFFSQVLIQFFQGRKGSSCTSSRHPTPSMHTSPEVHRPFSSSFHTQQGGVRRTTPPCNLWSEPSTAFSLTTHPFVNLGAGK